MKNKIGQDEFFGELHLDSELDWIYTKPFDVPCLGNCVCTFAFGAAENKTRIPEDLSKLKQAVKNFIMRESNFWNSYSEEMIKYCRDSENAWEIEGEEKVGRGIDEGLKLEKCSIFNIKNKSIYLLLMLYRKRYILYTL